METKVGNIEKQGGEYGDVGYRVSENEKKNN